MASNDRSAFRLWLRPLSWLLGAGFALFVLTFAVDVSGSLDPMHALSLLWHPNPQSAANALGNAGEVVAAVLGIAITVVAIIVELASNRYTHRITELFVGERTNFIVMGLFVVTGLQAMWVTMTFDLDDAGNGFMPRVSVAVTMGLLTLCLLILLPYFNFVSEYLNPVQIVDRISRHTLEVIAQRGVEKDASPAQQEAVRGIEQLADVSLNAMEHKDKGISMASVDALRELAIDYQSVRTSLSASWFRVDGPLAHNPDFVSMAPDVLEGVAARQIWFEMKVLRQYQMLYGEALNRMRDINYLIAINTRVLTEEAARIDRQELIALSIKFFNTYLRATINAKDVRTAYNVLNQYRLLAEKLLDYRGGVYSTEIARYFKYYGQLSYQVKLPFILETVAYDLCALNELAFDTKSPVADELLSVFLKVDKEGEAEAEQEASLRGVRKAQVKLAAHYLVNGDKDRAYRVFEDMKQEEPIRMASIRDELLSVQTPEFWEISDRGVNFDFLDAERKKTLDRFFAWFGDALPARASGLNTDVISLSPPDAKHNV